MIIDNYRRKTIEMAVARANDRKAEIAKLANGFGCDVQEVQKVFEEYLDKLANKGVKTDELKVKDSETTKTKKKPHQWTADEVKLIKNMYQELKNSTDIADALGLDREITRAKIKELQRKGYLKTLAQIKAEKNRSMDDIIDEVEEETNHGELIGKLSCESLAENTEKPKKPFVNEEFENAIEGMTSPQKYEGDRIIESLDKNCTTKMGNGEKSQRNIEDFLETENMFNDIVKSFGGKVLMKGCDYTGTANIQFELDDGRQFKIGLKAVEDLEYLGVWDDD